MIHDPDLLDVLQAIEPVPWAGTVYRHMVNDYPPVRENSSGARWNPPDVAAIYTCLDRDGAVAEFDYRMSVEPFAARFRVKRRTLYTIRVEVADVMDLTAREVLKKLGLSETLAGVSMTRCQEIGAAVSWLNHDGLLVLSARSESTNLVLYPNEHAPDAVFEVTAEEDIPT